MTTKEFMTRPHTIHRIHQKGYGRTVYLYVNQASNGPIFAYGQWSPRTGFCQYGWTNSAERSIAAVEEINKRWELALKAAVEEVNRRWELALRDRNANSELALIA
jgi:hypothetical protein